MADARQAIASMIAGEQAITQQLQDIGTVITIESNLEWMDANLNRISEANRPAVQADVNNSRTLLLNDKPAEADAARKEAQGKLLGQLSAVLPGKMTAQNMQFNATLPEPPKRQLHERLASFAAGTSPQWQAGKLVGLVLLGLFTLYAKDPTFGSNGLFDYFSIAVWGLSADVAQRTLQGLQLPTCGVHVVQPGNVRGHPKKSSLPQADSRHAPDQTSSRCR